jgi:1-aminocyclopropane-1-carboxylate deaminase
MDIQLFENTILNLPSPIQELKHTKFQLADVRVFIKRDDLIHPIISGNKWRKLKEYIRIAKENPELPILSFGGAYSNHLYALAYVGHQLNIRTIGIIRGNELNVQSNPYLTQMNNWGMEMRFVDRISYKEKKHNYGSQVIEIPEGGYGDLGIDGMKEFVSEITDFNPSHIITAVGTGTTALGIKRFTNTKVVGILTLNNLSELRDHEKESSIHGTIWKDGYIMGKYAKNSSELNEFCDTFEQDHQIKIEPIYTGRMFYGLYDLIESNYFPKGSTILALHTGGVKLANGSL